MSMAQKKSHRRGHKISTLELFAEQKRPATDSNPRAYAREKLYDSVNQIKLITENYLAFQELFDKGVTAKFNEFEFNGEKFNVITLHAENGAPLLTKSNDGIFLEGYIELPNYQGIITLPDFFASLKSEEFELKNSENPEKYLQEFTKQLLSSPKQDITSEFKQDLEDMLLNSYMTPAGIVGKDFVKFLWQMQKWDRKLYTTLKSVYENKFGSDLIKNDGFAPALWQTLEERAEEILSKEKKLENVPEKESLVAKIKSFVSDIQNYGLPAPVKSLMASSIMVLGAISGALLSKDIHAQSPDKSPDKDTNSRQDNLEPFIATPANESLVGVGDKYIVIAEVERGEFNFNTYTYPYNISYFAVDISTKEKKFIRGESIDLEGESVSNYLKWFMPHGDKLFYIVDYKDPYDNYYDGLRIFNLTTMNETEIDNFKYSGRYDGLNVGFWGDDIVCSVRYGKANYDHWHYNLKTNEKEWIDVDNTAEISKVYDKKALFEGVDRVYIYNLLTGKEIVFNESNDMLFTDFNNKYLVTQLFDEQNISGPLHFYDLKTKKLLLNMDAVFPIRLVDNTFFYGTPFGLYSIDLITSESKFIYPINFSKVYGNESFGMNDNYLFIEKAKSDSDKDIFLFDLNKANGFGWTQEQLKNIQKYAPVILHDSRADTEKVDLYKPADPHGDDFNVINNHENYDDLSERGLFHKGAYPSFVKITEYPEDGFDIYTYIYYRADNPHWAGISYPFAHEHDIQRVHVKVDRKTGEPIEIAYSQHFWMKKHKVSSIDDLVLKSEWGSHEYGKDWEVISDGKGFKLTKQNTNFIPFNSIISIYDVDENGIYKTNEPHGIANKTNFPPKGPWLYKDVIDPKSAFEEKSSGWFRAQVHSPVDLEVRVNDKITNKEKTEIPNSGYYNNQIGILGVNKTDKIELKLYGTDNGTYSLDCTLADDMPYYFKTDELKVHKGEIISFSFENWTAIHNGTGGIKVSIDRNGDGTPEYSFTCDNYLTSDEYTQDKSTESDFVWPLIIGSIIGGSAAAIGISYTLYRNRKPRQPVIYPNQAQIQQMPVQQNTNYRN